MYKCQESDRISSNVLLPAITVFNTRAIPNLIRTSFLPPEWCERFKSISRPHYTSASDDGLTIYGTILILACAENIRKRVQIEVIDHLAVPILVETSKIDRFIRGILTLERKLVHLHSGPVAVMPNYTIAVKSISTINITVHVPQSSESITAIFYVTKQNVLSSNIEMLVPGPTSNAGLQNWSTHPKRV